MSQTVRAIAGAGMLLAAGACPALAQKAGGTLRVQHWDSPASMSIHEEATRPIIFYGKGGTCWQPYVKNVNLMVDSIFNANRREDWWLDK